MSESGPYYIYYPSTFLCFLHSYYNFSHHSYSNFRMLKQRHLILGAYALLFLFFQICFKRILQFPLLYVAVDITSFILYYNPCYNIKITARHCAKLFTSISILSNPNNNPMRQNYYKLHFIDEEIGTQRKSPRLYYVPQFQGFPYLFFIAHPRTSVKNCCSKENLCRSCNILWKWLR